MRRETRKSNGLSLCLIKIAKINRRSRAKLLKISLKLRINLRRKKVKMKSREIISSNKYKKVKNWNQRTRNCRKQNKSSSNSPTLTSVKINGFSVMRVSILPNMEAKFTQFYKYLGKDNTLENIKLFWPNVWTSRRSQWVLKRKNRPSTNIWNGSEFIPLTKLPSTFKGTTYRLNGSRIREISWKKKELQINKFVMISFNLWSSHLHKKLKSSKNKKRVFWAKKRIKLLSWLTKYQK